MRTIPVIDLSKQYLSIQAEIDEAISHTLKKGSFILGNSVSAFETAFANYCESSFGIGVASGTDALLLALRACGVGPGDEVITSAHTAVATIAAIELSGARPVLADIDPLTFTIDTDQIQKKITSKTRAIIPVHLYGCPANLAPILATAKKNDLLIIQDCAQAHGAMYNHKSLGSFGDVAAFSFYPTKNLGAYGDAGLVVTNREDLADKLILLRQYGWKEKFISNTTGSNSRLDEIQAAVLRVKLKYLDQWNDRRRELASIYDHELASIDISHQSAPKSARHVYHQYVVRVSKRKELKSFLEDHAIQTAIHYPKPVHQQEGYIHLGYKTGDFPVTENISNEILSLPMYPELENEDVIRVCNLIKEFYL